MNVENTDTSANVNVSNNNFVSGQYVFYKADAVGTLTANDNVISETSYNDILAPDSNSISGSNNLNESGDNVSLSA